MNPQAYRLKLERAVEERDDLLLEELARAAGNSAATEQMWQDHLLIEQAISDWQLLAPALTSPKTETPARTATTYWRPLVSLAALLFVSLCGWYFLPGSSNTGIDQSLVTTVSAPVVPAEVGTQSETQETEHVLAWGTGPETSMSGQLASFNFLPSVTTPVKRSVDHTLSVITMLPDDIDAAWKQFQTLNPAQQTMTPETPESMPEMPPSPSDAPKTIEFPDLSNLLNLLA